LLLSEVHLRQGDLRRSTGAHRRPCEEALAHAPLGQCALACGDPVGAANHLRTAVMLQRAGDGPGGRPHALVLAQVLAAVMPPHPVSHDAHRCWLRCRRAFRTAGRRRPGRGTEARRAGGRPRRRTVRVRVSRCRVRGRPARAGGYAAAARHAAERQAWLLPHVQTEGPITRGPMLRRAVSRWTPRYAIWASWSRGPTIRAGHDTGWRYGAEGCRHSSSLSPQPGAIPPQPSPQATCGESSCCRPSGLTGTGAHGEVEPQGTLLTGGRRTRTHGDGVRRKVGPPLRTRQPRDREILLRNGWPSPLRTRQPRWLGSAAPDTQLCSGIRCATPPR